MYVWSLQFLAKGSSNLWVHSLKSLGKGSFCQRLLQIIIRINTLLDVIRVPKYVLRRGAGTGPADPAVARPIFLSL